MSKTELGAFDCRYDGEPGDAAGELQATLQWRRRWRKRVKVNIWTVVAALATMSGAASASNLIGENLTFYRAYPTTSTPFWDPSSKTTVVVAGISDLIDWQWIPGASGFTQIDPEDSSISWSSDYSNYLGSPSIFDGFVVSGFGRDIASISVLSTDNLAVALIQSARSFSINLSGSGADFVIRVQLVPVPEPSSWAMLAVGLFAFAARMKFGRPPVVDAKPGFRRIAHGSRCVQTVPGTAQFGGARYGRLATSFQPRSSSGTVGTSSTSATARLKRRFDASFARDSNPVCPLCAADAAIPNTSPSRVRANGLGLSNGRSSTPSDISMTSNRVPACHPLVARRLVARSAAGSVS